MKSIAKRRGGAPPSVPKRGGPDSGGVHRRPRSRRRSQVVILAAFVGMLTIAYLALRSSSAGNAALMDGLPTQTATTISQLTTTVPAPMSMSGASVVASTQKQSTQTAEVPLTDAVTATSTTPAEQTREGQRAGDGNPRVSLIMPVSNGGGLGKATKEELTNTLLAPLVAREAALCYRRPSDGDGGSGLQWSMSAVVVSDAAPGGAFTEWMTSLGAVPAVAGAEGGRDAAGSLDSVWTVPLQSVRDAVAQAGGIAHTAAAAAGGERCYKDSVTVVTTRPDADAAQRGDDGRPLLYLESYVLAGLRTAAGTAGTHFLVLPAHTVPTSAPFTTFDDETRRAPFGFTESLLMTATQRNKGRVAAVQCALLQRDPATLTEAEKASTTAPAVPVPLTKGALARYVVVDRGGFISAASSGIILPFVARRYAGLRGSDQRILFEEPTGGVSFHCGLFNTELYKEVAEAFVADLAQFPTVARPDGGREGTDPRTIHYAGDSAGWKLSLRMQAQRPAWQVYASRAVGVWVATGPPPPASPKTVLSTLELGLTVPLYALTDAYGQQRHTLLQLLQARRFGLGWRDRLQPLADDGAADGAAVVGLERAGLPPGSMLPPALTYYVDFPCACCGLAREAAGYLRPLIDRYSLTVDGNRGYCGKDGAAMLSMAFLGYRKAVFDDMSTADKTFWMARAEERVQVSFLHVRAPRYPKLMRSARRGEYTMSIGRSLSEFSNVQPDWVAALKSATDQVWATADFFKTVYRRHGVDEAKVRTVPEAVDAYEYDPANVEPLPMPFEIGGVADNMPSLTPEERRKRYVFLSMFKWEQRKGWDVLLSAYYDAFGPNAPPDMRDRATLILKVNFKTRYSRGLHPGNIGPYLKEWATRTKAIPNFTGLETLPHIIIVGGGFSNTDLVRLYATADAFIFPSRGEGWGLPASEAMAMGLPLIMTPWSGLLGFITPDTCFRIPLDGLEELPDDSRAAYGFNSGKKWALPSRNGTAELMRYVVNNPEHAREVGRRGRRLMLERFSEEAVADTMDKKIADFLRQAVKKKNGLN